MDVDNSFKVFSNLYAMWQEDLENIITEQDTRFKIINTILTEVLGWDKNDILTESHTESGFIDYLLKSHDKSKFIVEAKRSSEKLLSTVNKDVRSYIIDGPAMSDAIEGLEQARNYALDKSVPFAALTSGVCWVGFYPFRSDGTPWKRGKAIVFPSLEATLKNFAKFYDLFSKEGILKQNYKYILTAEEKINMAQSEALLTPATKEPMHLLQRNQIALDLESVFDKFFDRISSDSDIEMLTECFVESKESREADDKLEKITKNLIDQVDLIKGDGTSGLESRIREALENKEGQSVLIIGGKGAGKSTFVDRFFRLVLSRSLRNRCLVLKLDIGKSHGDLNTIQTWLTEQLKYEIEQKLFENSHGRPQYNDLQGIFFDDYQRWSEGQFKHLYETNKDDFINKFGEHINKQITDHPYEYTQKLLIHCVRNRNIMPCIIFDNTDDFPREYQEAIFQYSQAIRSTTLTFTICPITDRTIWKYSKSGPFQSHISHSFYLPVPSTKDVLEKRINFIKNKIDSEKSSKSNYFLQKGIKLQVEHLEAFACCLQDVFITTDYISRRIGMVCNFGIRRSLLLTKLVMTSPIITVDNFFTSYFSKKEFDIHPEKFYKALILSKHNSFNQEYNDYILNLFSIDHMNLTSPLSKLRILQLLKDLTNNAGDDHDSAYIEIDKLCEYFEPIGLLPPNIIFFLQEMLDYGLVEAYNPSVCNITEAQRVRILPCGIAHYEMATTNKTYLEQMAKRTPIRSTSHFDHLSGLINARSAFNSNMWLDVRKIFVEYCLEQDHMFISVPENEQYSSQKFILNYFTRCWRVANKPFQRVQ